MVVSFDTPHGAFLKKYYHLFFYAKLYRKISIFESVKDLMMPKFEGKNYEKNIKFRIKSFLAIQII